MKDATQPEQVRHGGGNPLLSADLSRQLKLIL
jgi:hypothetical protein